MNHLLYLALAVVTHAVVGYTLVRVFTSCNPAIGLVAGIFPDIDLYFGHLWDFPLVHRGLVHTPFFLAVLLCVVALVGSSERVVLGVGIAFLSHLLIDSFTNAGIMWLYPASVHSFSYDISIHSAVADVVFWCLSLGVIRWGGRDRLRFFE